MPFRSGWAVEPAHDGGEGGANPSAVIGGLDPPILLRKGAACVGMCMSTLHGCSSNPPGPRPELVEGRSRGRRTGACFDRLNMRMRDSGSLPERPPANKKPRGDRAASARMTLEPFDQPLRTIGAFSAGGGVVAQAAAKPAIMVTRRTFAIILLIVVFLGRNSRRRCRAPVRAACRGVRMPEGGLALRLIGRRVFCATAVARRGLPATAGGFFCVFASQRLVAATETGHVDATLARRDKGALRF